MIYNCRQCGNKVERHPCKVRPSGVFCSSKCFGLYSRKRIVATCDECGKSFERHPSQFNGDARYCSKVCADKGKTVITTISCDHCGGAFERHPRRAEKYKHNFCSTECHYAHRRNNPEEFYDNLDTPVDVVCATCGAHFKRKPSALIHKRHYCSKKCEYQGLVTAETVICAKCGRHFEKIRSQINKSVEHFCSRQCFSSYFVGDNSPHWQGGKSFEPYTVEFNEQVKEYVRSRDGRICQGCGKTEEENGRKLSVHHCDYEKANCSPDYNLITLCISCNTQANYKRGFWAEYYLVKLHEMRVVREVA